MYIKINSKLTEDKIYDAFNDLASKGKTIKLGLLKNIYVMKQNIIEKIGTCIKLIDDRFLLKHYQLRGISIEQLKLFRDKLTLISESINNNSFECKNTNMGKIIVDS